MGQNVDRRTFGDHAAHRDKVRRCQEVLARMLREHDFSIDEPMIGIEIELNLVDEDGRPALKNAEALSAIGGDEFQTELAQYNIEVNVAPVPVAGHGLERMRFAIRDNLNAAQQKATGVGANLVIIGILPTVTDEHIRAGAITPNPRYRELSEQILAARGEDILLDIDGVDHLHASYDTVMAEAACTSTQFHLQVDPSAFGSHWNAAQMVAGVQIALGANSPFLLGRQLWQETRIPLFEQSIDMRNAAQREAGDLPRVLFGTGWIDSVLDLFQENLDRFPAILPVIDAEDPEASLAAGKAPGLAELRMLNGTIYRWNRPVYDPSGTRPHLRLENRVLPSGPTLIDMFANAAFYYGVVSELAATQAWADQAFETAERNFYAAARWGMQVEIDWPGLGLTPVAGLVDDVLLPAADRGLHRLGVDPDARRLLLEVIVGRCRTGRNGATWQVAELNRLLAAGEPRSQALAAMTREYEARMHSGEPVHTW
jgi:hypothetical protein